MKVTNDSRLTRAIVFLRNAPCILQLRQVEIVPLAAVRNMAEN